MRENKKLKYISHAGTYQGGNTQYYGVVVFFIDEEGVKYSWNTIDKDNNTVLNKCSKNKDLFVSTSFNVVNINNCGYKIIKNVRLIKI